MPPGETKAEQPPRRGAAVRERRARAEELLGLFAWHKDAPLVARALRLTLDELQAQLDDLGIRRKAFRLARSAPGNLPRATPLPGVAGGPPVRRRVHPPEPPTNVEAPPESAAPPANPSPSGTGDVAAQAVRLRTLLGEIGPRRRALAQQLGTKGRPLSTPVLLARFRAAGLERELGQRERDLLRALFARHRGGERKVAEDLDLTIEDLRGLVRERGLAREVEAMRERYRGEARKAAWPAAQLSHLALRRAWLEDLGLHAELSRLAVTRAAPAWEKARRSKDPVQALRRELRVGPAEARFLRDLLSRSTVD
jgi:hypothetical protein